MSVMPLEIIKELQELTNENRRGVEYLKEAEDRLAYAENRLDTEEAHAFLAEEGSVAERTAKAKLSAAEARLARDLAKAEVNRIRMKLRVIESAIMAQATMSKIMQAEMKL
jgi:exonuclease VII small subunit